MTSRRPSNGFARALRSLRTALDALKIPSAIIGGIAMNANGIARFTEDVDATIPGADLDVAALVTRLRRHGIAPRQRDAVKFARRSQVLLLRHTDSGVDLDVSLAWIDFELEAIRRARELTFGSARIRVARPEDLLIYKLIANRPQDLWDAERLLLLFRSRIDLDRVRKVLADLSEHLDGPDRSTILRSLLNSLPPKPRRR